MEITLHTGNMGDRNKINIDWLNSNMVSREDILEINIKDQDKPRELEVLLNDVVIATIKH